MADYVLRWTYVCNTSTYTPTIRIRTEYVYLCLSRRFIARCFVIFLFKKDIKICPNPSLNFCFDEIIISSKTYRNAIELFMDRSCYATLDETTIFFVERFHFLPE